MPVSGVVVVLTPEPAARAAALAALSRDPRVTLGPSEGLSLAAVLESASTQACGEHVREIEAIEGVLAVRPVFHDFSDEVGSDAAP